jgi:Bacterial Ig-like domain (group 2)
LIPIGHKQQLSAIGSFTDGTTYDLTGYVNWNSDNAQVAAVDAHGMAFAANVGSAHIHAAYEAMVGAAAVTVQPELNIVYFHLPQNGPDTTMRISNPGLSGTDLCAMIYVFDQKQQLVECCGCTVSLDGLLVLSLRNDLTANPLTGIKSTDGVVSVIAADHEGNPKCDASSISPSGILASWSTNLESTGNGGYSVLEDSATSSPLSDQQLSASQAQCSFAKTLGSGQGTCSCGSGN